MSAAQVSIAMKHAACRRETQCRAMLQYGVFYTSWIRLNSSEKRRIPSWIRWIDFAAGLFRALVHVCRAPRPRAHVRPSPGGRHPCRVPCPGLPSPADLRPASHHHHSAASCGGTSKVNQYADRGGTPTVNQCTACGGTQDPVRGQSSVAGDVNPRAGGALENDRGANVPCAETRNVPPRNAMA